MKKDLIITIFGSTGDLTSRKLLPAITKLYTEKQISENVLVLALGRRDYDTKSYLEFVSQSKSNKVANFDVLHKIVKYHKMEITQPDGYESLKELINEHSHEHTKSLFYLAVGPEMFADISMHINTFNLVTKGDTTKAIVFEKPFGHDLDSAKAINQTLWKYFDESQIYRIDHYLGKEMIQNIMTVRFANRIFEEAWHNRSIKSVTIVAKEDQGILGRAGYYDQSGALKDMVQSHLLQILSLLAMEVPVSYNSHDVKNEKVEVMNNLTFDKHATIFGQYKGYLTEPNIKPNSKTDTFVFIKAFVNTPRFKGVPFYLMTGKKLDEKVSYIEIEFEATNEQKKWNLPLSKNKLIIKFAPYESVELVLNSKTPGLRENVQPITLELNQDDIDYGNRSEAYEKLILDITNGHKTLFTRWDEIESSWHFIDKIKARPHELVIYENYDQLKKLMKEKADVVI